MKILIAEDELLARKFLESALEEWGHEVIPTSNGKEAWEKLQEPDAPRLVILDWSMPQMDGVEVCRRIRANNKDSYSYVILLTSRTQQEDIDTAYMEGVDDYLFKPFDEVQLQRRLKVAMRVFDYEDKLANSSHQLGIYATQMEKLAEERGQQLAHAERIATLGMLSAGIAHEINNPTTFIAGNIRILNDFWPMIKDALENKIKDANDPNNRIPFIRDEVPGIINGITNGVQRITKIVNGLKTYARQGEFRTQLCNINDCIEQALTLCTNALKYHVCLEKELDPSLPSIMADPQQIEQVMVNLLINAADALEGQRQGLLKIETWRESSSVRIKVEDNGPGLPPNQIDKIWEPFFTSKAPGKGTGLGLSIIHGIIQNHSGEILAENSETGGARFIVTLPKNIS